MWVKIKKKIEKGKGKAFEVEFLLLKAEVQTNRFGFRDKYVPSQFNKGILQLR